MASPVLVSPTGPWMRRAAKKRRLLAGLGVSGLGFVV